MESEERHRRIVIQFISSNQGCTAEQLVDGVDKEISRVPVYKTLKGLLRYIDERLPEEYEKCLVGLTAILR